MDLFGLGKKKTDEAAAAADAHASPAEPAPSADNAAAPEAAPAPRGSHRLWAFLLVLDSVFVVVFAGAVAAKFYQHWRAPSAPAHQSRRPGKEPKPAEAPAPAPVAAAPTPAPAPEPVKEAPKEAPKAAAKAEPGNGAQAAVSAAHNAPRPPKPSLLNDAPKPRTTPALAGTAAAPKAAPAAASAPAAGAERPKAKPIAFRLRAPSAKNVALVGAFIVRGGRKEMSKDGDGVWNAEIYLHPGQYRYFFSVDKKKVLDPENPREERGASLLNVP